MPRTPKRAKTTTEYCPPVPYVWSRSDRTRTPEAIYKQICAVRAEANNMPTTANPTVPSVFAHDYWTRQADAIRVQQGLWSELANAPGVPAYARAAIHLAAGELQTQLDQTLKIAANLAAR